MNKKKLLMRYRNKFNHTKHSEQGMTLFEVIIAMIVLAIGILAILATQLKSVSSVREAESQTIVSQIVQNLTEGMLINPVLSAGSGTSDKALAKKSYDEYVSYSSAINCSRANMFNDNMSKSDLTMAQLCQFDNSLKTALPDAKIDYRICKDTSEAKPTVDSNGNINFNCTNHGDYIVKVIWQMDTEESNGNNSSLKMNGSKVVYSYQSRITK